MVTTRGDSFTALLFARNFEIQAIILFYSYYMQYSRIFFSYRN